MDTYEKLKYDDVNVATSQQLVAVHVTIYGGSI